jgi:hypothetical protein
MPPRLARLSRGETSAAAGRIANSPATVLSRALGYKLLLARLPWRVVRISDSNSCPSSVFNPVTSRATLFRDAVVVFRTPGQGVQAAQHQPTPALAAQGEFLKRFFMAR